MYTQDVPTHHGYDWVVLILLFVYCLRLFDPLDNVRAKHATKTINCSPISPLLGTYAVHTADTCK